ncbi:TonB-dependent siderophore receptor [Nostoc sp.]|uniref:TonB-dependent siderophore receptor n=1 Tax=Nostoc sp. TaxID=1180 RepID=UPI002FF9C9A1
MKLVRSLFISCFFIAVVIQPTQAKQVTEIQSVQELDRSARTVKEWFAQIQQQNPPAQNQEGEVVQVTSVKANPTSKGVEIILQTSKGEQLQVVNQSSGNNFIADIPNAQLRLPSGDAFTFRSIKPIAGVSEITVTNFNANSIRVSVTGEAGVPIVELFDSPDEGIIFSVATAASPVQPQQPESQTQPSQPSTQSNEPIELVVTGERDEGYNPSRTSVGTRTDTPLRDIPQTIQIIPQQVIKDRNVTRLRDVLNNVSGVAQSGGDYGGEGFGIGDYLIRGFRGQTTLNGFTGTGSPGDFSNVEQVEVVRGPASVLFGSGDPGGIINVTTKQPLSEPFYEVGFNAGSYNYYRGTVDLSAPLNPDRSLRYRLNIALQDSDSFRDFVGTKRFFLAPTIAWDISDDTKLTLNFEYLNKETAFDVGVPALSNGSFVLPINRYFGYPSANDINTTQIQGGYTLEHRFNKNLQLRNSLFISSQHIDLIDSEYGTLSDDRFITGTYVKDKPVYETYAMQTGLIANFNTGSVAHQVLFGFDANRVTNFFSSLTAPLPPLDIFNPNYNIELPTDTTLSRSIYVTQSYSAYLQDQIKLLDNLILVAAGQFDWVNNTGSDIIAGTVNRDYGEAFSPRIGIVYRPIEPVSVYASYSRSFLPNNGRSRTNSAFAPSRGTQYEVGIKGDFLDGKLSTLLAAYDITKSNVLTTDPVAPNYSIQVGEQRSRGIDLSVTGEILPGWNLTAGYSYIDARITKDNTYEVGSLLRITPTNSVSLWTTYRIKSGDLQGLGFGFGTYFVGERLGDQFDPPNFKLPAYTRFDAALFYRRNNWEVAINAENLFDVEYYTESRNSASNSPGAPFTIIGSLTVRF